MNLSIRWSTRAADRLEEAVLYLESVRKGAGLRLLEQTNDALKRASEHPESNPTIPGEPNTTRKIVISKFGYWIIYDVKDDLLVVLTVWSAIREPKSYRSDLPKE